MDAWEVFKKNITNNRLLKSSDRVLLAVSGGPDSICMLHMFWRISKIIPLELYCVSFDHQLRKESKQEVELVSSIANDMSIAIETKILKVKEYAKKENISIETSARNLRYCNLIEIAESKKCNIVATAHNANDNAETVLMWLARGSGGQGITGIPVFRNLTKKIKVLRPILPITRNSIERYIQKNKLSFCIDKSNLSKDYTRNKVRISIVPELEKINPKVVEHIYTLSQIQTRENEYLDSLTERAFKKSVSLSKTRILLDLTSFFRYNETLRYRLLKKILPDRQYSLKINEVMDHILSNKRSIYILSEDWSFKIMKERGIFFKK